ncbi:hypothetical protein K7J14_00280 [Treponema zuelzerae]|uniref:Uncharacterized protein n=1 Tax=Teretinema zuelzerae TaxID=156 RepID=A0AAE3EF13_9SPIR|nr:hypothetical protein [Teretinema zuelzerae]MCD1653147.1 hypothetical protein [Teretinema zuelzerae]
MSFTCKDSIQLISDFVNSKLHGYINELRFFSFSELEHDRDFGLTTNGSFDEDDTELARAILFLIWYGRLPELSFEEIGSGKKYRGDTINTFNTLFGKEDQYKNLITESSFDATITAFKKKYVTIGNFMLMPNSTGGTGNGITSINCYRGVGSGWFDYFDKFLIELDTCLKGNTNDANEKLQTLVSENSFYFGKINTIQKFCEINYLDSYLLNTEVQSLFTPYMYHWKFKKIDSEVRQLFTHFAISYINHVEKIINRRSLKMLQIIIDRMK